MDNLRLILLIIGCLIVLGIYIWEIFRSNAPKNKTDILNAVDEIPDSPMSPDEPLAPVKPNDVSIGSLSNDTLTDLGGLLTQTRNNELEDPPRSFHVEQQEPVINDDEDDIPLPLDMSVKDYEATLNKEAKLGAFSTHEETEQVQHDEQNIEQSSFPKDPENNEAEETINNTVAEDYELALEPNEIDIPENNKTSDDLLVLYITSPSHISFNGLSISKAADEVGMIYGHMNIFHHFGPGKLHSGQPLFSLANMHEPGSFDLGRMSDLKTKGLAIFMYSPASIDASVVFELFLNTAQRLAELLGGTVRTADNEILNNVKIKSLREKAEALSIN